MLAFWRRQLNVFKFLEKSAVALIIKQQREEIKLDTAKKNSVVASQPLLLASFDKLIKKSKRIAFHFHLICFASIVTVGSVLH